MKDANRDLRVFRGVFPGKSSRPRDRFTFTGSSTALVVSVDYTQSGEWEILILCNDRFTSVAHLSLIHF